MIGHQLFSSDAMNLVVKRFTWLKPTNREAK